MFMFLVETNYRSPNVRILYLFTNKKVNIRIIRNDIFKHKIEVSVYT